MQYIRVTKDESSDQMEIPSEDDGTLLLTTLAAQYPGACGLKYPSPETGAYRGLRLANGKLHAPNETWGNTCYYVVYGASNEKKRKADDSDNGAPTTKRRSTIDKKCSDLIVLGLAYSCDKDQLEKYFSDFGTVVVAEVKVDNKTQRSKGFGFVRFEEYEAQIKVLAQRHNIAGRWCDVRLPSTKGGQEQPLSRKIFVGRCTESMTSDILREYFEKFGEVTDVFIPQPFRGFAFVSFSDPNIANALCNEDHVIANCSCHVTAAVPKSMRGDQPSQGHRGGRGDDFNQRGPYASSGGWTPRGGGGRNFDGGRDYDRGYERDRGSYDRGYDQGGYDRRNYDKGEYRGNDNAPPPVPSGGGGGGDVPRDAISSAMMEQMSSIMAAAISAATQNLGGQGQQQSATAASATSPSTGNPGSSSYGANQQQSGSGQRWEQSSVPQYSTENSAKGTWGGEQSNWR